MVDFQRPGDVNMVGHGRRERVVRPNGMMCCLKLKKGKDIYIGNHAKKRDKEFLFPILKETGSCRCEM